MYMDNGDKKTRHIPEISDEHWNALNEIRKAHKETWADTFERFYNYQDWVGHLFNLPKETDDVAIINASTVTQLLPMWLENMRQNTMKGVEIPDVKEIENSAERGTPGLVIGAGPSSIANNHLHMLRDSVFYNEHKGKIVSTAHSLEDCLEAGVVPDYMVLIDADPVMMKFIDHDIVDEHSRNITGIFSISADHNVVERWGGRKVFFMSVVPDITIPNVPGVLAGLFPNITVMNAMANSGSFSWNVARYIGCDPIALIGLDFSFKPEFPIKDTPYYKPLRASSRDEKEMISKWYRFHTHSFFGTNCYTDHVHDTFASVSVKDFKAYKEHGGITTINCTEGGIIDDEAVENMWFRDWLKKWE